MKLESPLEQYIGKCIKFDLQRMYKETAKVLPAITARYYYITGIDSKPAADTKLVSFKGVNWGDPPSAENTDVEVDMIGKLQLEPRIILFSSALKMGLMKI